MGLEKLKWMIPLEEFEKEFERIEAQNIIIYKNQFLKYLIQHLRIRILNDVFSWCTDYPLTKEGRKVSTLMTEIERVLDKIQYPAKRRNKTSITDSQINHFIKVELYGVDKDLPLEPCLRNDPPPNVLLINMKGKLTGKFYHEWYTSSFPYTLDILKSNSFLRQTMPLHKLIFRHKHFPTSTDFKEEWLYKKNDIDIQVRYVKSWIFHK